MVQSSVCLIGGPPWGLRFAVNNDGCIVVAQVLPDGRAYKEGIRIGDVVEAINGEPCTGTYSLQSKMRDAQGMLKLRVRRDSQRRTGRHLPPVPKKAPGPVPYSTQTLADMEVERKLDVSMPLTIETHEKPIPLPRQMKLCEARSPQMTVHRIGHISLPQKAAEYMAVEGYSGGHRGSAEDKRRFFEMIANKQQLLQHPSQTDRLLHQKIQMGGSIALPSDQTTVISGYDSVGGDFAALNRSTTATEASRHSPTSCDLTEDEWMQDRPQGSLPMAGMLSPRKPPGDVQLESNRYTPVHFTPSQQQQTESNSNGFLYRSPTPLAAEQNTVVQNAATTLDALVAQVSKLHSSARPLQRSEDDRISKGVFGGDAPTTTAAKGGATKMVPPAPPPPPMSPTSFSKGNWSVKTKPSNDGTAEGSVEIPERQSVASLREQIANKLEVKAPNGTKAIVHNARERHRSCVTPTSFERPPKSVLPLRFSADISAPINGSQPYVQQAPTQNHTPDSTAQIGKPIVHEPAKRHISCITPLPFSRSLPESASLQSVPVVTPASEKSFTSDYHSNYESTPLPQSTSNDGFQASVDYSEKPSIRENNIATFARNSDFSSKFNVENEGRDSAIDLTPPVKLASNEPTKFTNGYASDHMLASPSSAMSASSAQPEMPQFSTPYDPETQRLQEAHHAHTSPASRSGVPAGSRDAPALSLLQADGASKRDDSLKQRYASISQRRTPTPDAAMHQQSDTSFWYKNMFKMMHKIEQRDQSVLKYRNFRDLASPTPSYHGSRAWTPTPRFGSRPESRLEYECLPPRRSKSVGRYVDSTLHNDEDIVERWREERARLSSRSTTSPQQSPSSAQATSAAVHANEDGAMSKDFLELKKSIKEEMLNRQRVEKLTEELEQQRSRRHGYIPSASPALQKNFDRFDGLLNDFGRDGRRSTTPAWTATPTIIATCTALFSFRAQSARELSFNRGDVIRVHRAVDANWLEGERNGQSGIFPISYVQMDEGLPAERMKLIALYPFFARNRNELSLKKGEVVRYRRTVDPNWMEGVNSRGEIGIFPKTYVQEFRDSDERITAELDIDGFIPDRPKTPKIVSSLPREESPLPSKKMNHGDEVQAWQRKHTEEGLSGPAHIVPKNAETYRALYAYKPQNVDELELRENDIVFVVEKCDDGWYIGTLLRTGQFGTFPGNYVERH